MGTQQEDSARTHSMAKMERKYVAEVEARCARPRGWNRKTWKEKNLQKTGSRRLGATPRLGVTALIFACGYYVAYFPNKHPLR